MLRFVGLDVLGDSGLDGAMAAFDVGLALHYVAHLLFNYIVIQLYNQIDDK